MKKKKFLDVTLNEREEIPEVEEINKQYNWMWENNINSGRELIDIDKPQEFSYNQWRTNISLSNFVETLENVEVMNENYHLDNKLHYHYLFYSVRKARRYGKKKTDEDKKLERQMKDEQKLLSLIQDYYKYNIVRAKEALKILSPEQIEIIKKKQEKGGVK